MSRRFWLARKAGAGRPTTWRSTVSNQTLVFLDHARPGAPLVTTWSLA
ncbi:MULTISPECIES: hypothetical protein [Paraburkholderia]|uniref:Uncharacterized protein n=1 Tax=Paraburkholderia youngii TaxID=2782701 RepID=A0A7Y6N0G4_9BURK|nr:hypothetical protein [Paraburkholderia youngii]NUY04113.1 hypothetical protein [Paraburkholderia youngii]